MFEKIVLPNDSDQLPGVFITVSQLQIRITPWVLKKIEIVFGCAFFDQEKLFDKKKTGDEKSSDTVP